MHTILFSADGAPVEAASYSEPQPLRPGEVEVSAAQHSVWETMRLVGDVVIEDAAAVLAASCAAARARRNAALTASDRRVLPDYPQTEAERDVWLAYRAALRAWPQQAGWPDTEMPAPPV